jgi:hypothetical protein
LEFHSLIEDSYELENDLRFTASWSDFLEQAFWLRSICFQ